MKQQEKIKIYRRVYDSMKKKEEFFSALYIYINLDTIMGFLGKLNRTSKT